MALLCAALSFAVVAFFDPAVSGFAGSGFLFFALGWPRCFSTCCEKTNRGQRQTEGAPHRERHSLGGGHFLGEPT